MTPSSARKQQPDLGDLAAGINPHGDRVYVQQGKLGPHMVEFTVA